MIIPYKVESNKEGKSIGVIMLSIFLLLIWAALNFILPDSFVHNIYSFHEYHPIFGAILSNFLHANVFHVLGNALSLVVIGTYAVNEFGYREIAKLLVPYVFFSALIKSALGISDLGFSGCVMTLIGFVIATRPAVNLKLKYFFLVKWGGAYIGLFWVVIFYVLCDVAGVINNLYTKGDGVSHIGHLIGFGYGVLFATRLSVRIAPDTTTKLVGHIRSRMTDFVRSADDNRFQQFYYWVNILFMCWLLLTCTSIYFQMANFSPDPELNRDYALKLSIVPILLMVGLVWSFVGAPKSLYLISVLLLATVILNVALGLSMIGYVKIGALILISAFVSIADSNMTRSDPA